MEQTNGGTVENMCWCECTAAHAVPRRDLQHACLTVTDMLLTRRVGIHGFLSRAQCYAVVSPAEIEVADQWLNNKLTTMPKQLLARARV